MRDKHIVDPDNHDSQEVQATEIGGREARQDQEVVYPDPDEEPPLNMWEFSLTVMTLSVGVAIFLSLFIGGVVCVAKGL